MCFSVAILGVTLNGSAEGVVANWVQFKTTENGEAKSWFNLDAEEVIRTAPQPYIYATEIITSGGKVHLVFEKPDVVATYAQGK